MRNGFTDRAVPIIAAAAIAAGGTAALAADGRTLSAEGVDGGGFVTVNVSVGAGASPSDSIYAASYDAAGGLLAVKTAAAPTAAASVAFVFDSGVKGERIKVCLWDSRMTPLAEAVEIGAASISTPEDTPSAATEAAVSAAPSVTPEATPSAPPITPEPTQASGRAEQAVHYDMSHTGGKLTDVSGNGNDGILRGISDTDFTTNEDDDILVLPGGGAYVELPFAIADGLNYEEGFTVEMALMPVSAQYQFLWTIGTGDQTNYLGFNPARAGWPSADNEMQVSVKTERGEEFIPNAVKLDTDRMSVITVVSRGQSLFAYRDGEYLGALEHEHDLSAIFKDNGNGLLGYIGKSNYPWDPYCDAVITDFRIYRGALEGDEIAEEYTEYEAKQKLREAMAEVELPAYTYDSLNLPVTGKNDTVISWISSDPTVLDTDGTVTAGTENTDVTLTAVFGDGSASLEKSFTVTVVAAGSEGRLNYIADNLDLGISYAADDISLCNERDGAAITWTGNELINSDGTVNRIAAEDTETELKATFSYNGKTIERTYPITVAGKTAGYLTTYVAKYEHDMGSEFAEYPSNKYTDNARTDVMYYALSADGESYTALNNDKAVFSATMPNPSFGTKFRYQFGSPNIFRKADGSYGMIAGNNNDTPEVLLYDSEDLLFFDNQRAVTLNGEDTAVKNPTVKYDNLNKLYEIYWEGGDGKSYVSTTADLRNIVETRETEYAKPGFAGRLPVYARSEEASEFELTKAEYNRISRKYGELHSVGVSCENTIDAAAGERVTLPETATVEYSDGSTKEMGIVWDTGGVDLDNLAPGVYSFDGKIDRLRYSEPFARFRADPQIKYVEKDDSYYFTSSYMQENCDNAYRYVILRRSDTIEGLSDAEGGAGNEAVIWSEERGGGANPWYWAPELHFFDDKYNILFLSTYGDEGWRMTVISCNGENDPMNPDNWYLRGTVKPDGNGKYPGAFDTTFFEYDGQCYYVSPSDSSIWIARFDPNDPLTLTSNLVKISTADKPWEYNIGQPGAACDHQYIEEASYVMIHDGRIFITYACATVDNHYAIGLLYADLDSDFTDPASWRKYPYPLLTTSDLTETIAEPSINEVGTLSAEGKYRGAFGPGHNSITYDKYGNPIVIYHARVWGENYVDAGAKYGLTDPGRHAFAGSVNWSIDGFPVMNMTAERELAPELENVTVTVTVGSEEERENAAVKGLRRSPGSIGGGYARAELEFCDMLDW